MTINFPSSLDTVAEFPSNWQNSDPSWDNHIGQHNRLSELAVALENKIGVDGSAVATSLDYLVTTLQGQMTSGSDPGHMHTVIGASGEKVRVGAGLGAGEKGIAIRYGSPTADAVGVQAEEQGVAYRDVYLQHSGGRLIIGGSSFSAGAGFGNTLGVKGSSAANYVLGDFQLTATGSAGTDMGALRGYAQQSSGQTQIRGIEGHVLRTSAASLNYTWAAELGVHTQVSGDDGVSKNVGLFIQSAHTGWQASGVRADTAILIQGEDGWNYATVYRDVDNSSVLWYVTSAGAAFHAGGIGIGLAPGTYDLGLGGAAARTLGMGRETGTNTGKGLTISAGGAPSGATDKDGGSVILQGGVTTGTGKSSVIIKALRAGTTGSGDNSTYDTLLEAKSRFLYLGESQTIVVDSQNNRLGVRTAAPAAALEVAGGCVLGTSSAAVVMGTGMPASYSGFQMDYGNLAANVGRIQAQSQGVAYRDLCIQSDGASLYLGNEAGDVIIGDYSPAALATSATTGFIFIPTCAGAPSGAPASYTGKVALVYDTTNNKLYARNGASWKSVTLA